MSVAYREKHYHAQDDLRLYYRDYGDPASPRTPLLCLTGLTRNSHDFDHFATRHAGERRVICPDYRGRGRSAYDHDWRNYRPETYLSDIRHLLTALDLHRAIVVGTSLGGILAMALGVLLPKVLRGVVLNDVGPTIGASGLARILGYIGRDRPQPDWPSATAHLKTMFPKLGLESEEDWRFLAEGTFRPGSDGLLHFDWDVSLARPLLAGSGGTPDLWPLFRSLRHVPTLALRGGVSDVLTEDTFEEMARAKCDLVRITIPAVGHTPSLDEPAAQQALTAFLAAL